MAKIIPDNQRNLMAEDDVMDFAALVEKAIVSCLSKDERQRIIRFLEKSVSDFMPEQMSDIDLAVALTVSFPTERGFYMMVRIGRLKEVMQILQTNKFSAEEAFQYISNTMIELNTKRIPIDQKMEVYLQLMLSNYAYRNLCSDPKIDKDFNEWRMHFKEIEDNYKTLKKYYNDYNFANVDNMFLYRIQTIHNQLYFIRNKHFLKHLPILETTFCLAMFVSIFKWSSEYRMYRLLMNKINVMQFTDVICRQLIKIRKQIDEFAKKLRKLLDNVSSGIIPSKEQLRTDWSKVAPRQKLGKNIVNKIIKCLKKKTGAQEIIDEVISSEPLKLLAQINCRDRRTLRQLNRCYFRVRYLYSMRKCVDHIEAMSAIKDHVIDMNSFHLDQVIVPATKRFVQVIGEATKCTKSSPNMPKRAESILKTMLSSVFPKYISDYREFYSHQYSLAKKILPKRKDDGFSREIVSGIDYIKMVFSFTLVLSISEASQTMLGFMRCCRGMDQLETLFQYIPDLDFIEEEQMERYETVTGLFEKVRETISQARASNDIDQAHQSNLNKILFYQNNVIELLGTVLISQWPNEFNRIKKAWRGKAPLPTIYHMIEHNLASGFMKTIYEIVKNHWDTRLINPTLLRDNQNLSNSNPFVICATLTTNNMILSLIKDEQYMEHTEKILQECGELQSSQDPKLLNEKLLKYYDNIFNLDKKYHVLAKYFKTQNPRLYAQLLMRMRQNDEKELQQIFNNKIKKLGYLLKAYKLSTEKQLMKNVNKVPLHAVMALEHYQLELCEILITVGFYGDNFHLMKHRIPLIHGRNYRNYLAHDKLSYNVLTDSSRVKVIINAFTMVRCPIVLFGRNKVAPAFKNNFPTIKNTLEWTTRQQSLAESIQKLNHADIQKNLKGGADLLGRFCHTIGPLSPLYTSLKSLRLVDPNSLEVSLPQIVQLFQNKYPYECTEIMNPLYRLWHAAQQNNFEKSFEIFTAHLPVINSALPQHFFYWEHLITKLRNYFVDFNETDWLRRSVLHRLSQAGNFSGVEELLRLKPDIDVNVLDAFDKRPFDYVLECGYSDLGKLLGPKTKTFSDENLAYAIRNHQNDLLPHFFVTCNPNGFHIACRANNLVAFRFLTSKVYDNQNAKLIDENNVHILSCIIIQAACYNFSRIVKYMLSLSNVDYFSDANFLDGSNALNFAIDNKNWSLVKLLLRRGASPHALHADCFLPIRTAFQLAVKADRVNVVRWMGKDFDKKMYQKLRHPLAIAVENDSSKMVKYLERVVGFSMLDTNMVLQSAIMNGREKFVKRVFEALDESINQWNSTGGSFVGMIGSILSRWKVIAYLEEHDLQRDPKTVLMAVIRAENWSFMEELIKKCKELRKFNGMYMTGIQMFGEENLIYTHGQSINPEYMELWEELLNRMKVVARSDCCPLKIQLNTKRSIDAVLFNDISLIKESILKTSNIGDLKRYCVSLQKKFQNTNSLFCGVIKDNPETDKYFVICSMAVCLLEMSHKEQEYPLKRMVNAKLKHFIPLHALLKKNSTLAAMELLVSNGAELLVKDSLGDTPLFIALHIADCSKTISLLKHKSVLGLTSLDGIPPIYFASMAGKLETVRFLLNQGADLRFCDTKGKNAVIFAAENSHRRMLKLMLDHDPELVRLKFTNQETLFHVTAIIGDGETAKFMLNYGPDLTEEEVEKSTAVEIAIKTHNVAWLKVVLDYARVNNISNLIGSRNSNLGISLFMFSVLQNDREILQVVTEYEIGNKLTNKLPRSSVQQLRKLLLSKTASGLSMLDVAWLNCFEEASTFIMYCQDVYNKNRGSDSKMDLAAFSFLSYWNQMFNSNVPCIVN